MKKQKFAMVLGMAIFAIASASAEVLYSGKVNKSVMELGNNQQYGHNYQFLGDTGKVFPDEYQAKAGDVIKIHFVGTVDKPLVVGKADGPKKISYFFSIVDTSAQANYWTKLCADDNNDQSCGDPIDKGGTITIDYTFTIAKDGKVPVNKGGANFMMGTSHQQRTSARITVKEFTYEITRP